MYMLVLFLFFRNIKYACKNFKLFYNKKKKNSKLVHQGWKRQKDVKKKSNKVYYIILHNSYLINIFLIVHYLIII